MKISKMIRLFIAAFSAASVAVVVLSTLAYRANENAVQSLLDQAEYKRLGLQLMDASDFLTQQAQGLCPIRRKAVF